MPFGMYMVQFKQRSKSARQAQQSSSSHLGHQCQCRLQGARAKLSQDLVALWGDGCAPAAALLRRVFPPGLLRFLSLGRTSPGTLSSLFCFAGFVACMFKHVAAGALA